MLTLFQKVFYETEFQPKLVLEQCLVRNFLHALVVLTTLIAQYFGAIGTLHPLVVTFGFTYIGLSILSTFLIYRYHQLSKFISIAGTITDTSIICFIMYMGGDKEASLYGLLIFLVVANGVRFGKVYMQFANLVCLTGFITVVSLNEFWQSHVLLTVGNIIWLILIPAHLKNLLTHLEDAIVKAESANVAKTLFIANMSHEIRTPLTSIIGFAKTLLNKKQSPEINSETVAAIIRNGEHLSAIVNDILDISKIEAGKLVLDKREFSIIGTIQEIDTLFRQRADLEKLNFTINYNFPLPAAIYSDSLRIKQILINLCSNAIKFTKEGSIIIDIDFDAKNNQLLFSVKDTGIGLSKSKLSDIFTNFTQANSSTTREYGGTGLGLSISAKLAEMLDGKLWVKSELGEGSTFFFTVSCGNPADNTLLHELPKPADNKIVKHQTHVRVSGTILLVEDITDNQILISTILKDMGATVDIADNGLIALEKVTKNNYDLVLLDLQMPVMGGIEALTKMREQNYTSPVVFLTANVIQNEEKESKNIDCQGFLSKPLDEERLWDVVSTYLTTTDEIIEQSVYSASELSDDNIIISTLLDGKDKATADKYKAMVEAFVSQLHERIDAISLALQSDDYEELRKLLHNIKGLGGNMGYHTITDISERMEFAISKNDSDKLDLLVQDLYKTEKKIAAGIDIYNKNNL